MHLTRLLAKVSFSDGCWTWTGAATTKGYGRFKIGRKTVLAHRWLYAAMYGEVARNIDVCHHCDNPRCVRPSHLFAGTRSENMLDCSRKGRLPVKDHSSLMAIPAERAADVSAAIQDQGAREIAAEFGCSHRAVQNFLKRHGIANPRKQGQKIGDGR